MDRRDLILKYITREQRGIEVGPYHSPLVPKRLGYNSLVADVYDTQTLRQKAAVDPLIPVEGRDSIEEVDLVGSAMEIKEMIATRGELGIFDYIVSSHNFEHLVNPIGFLQGCGEVLKSGGMMSMAIPDRRRSFDYFRPVTTLAEWVESYLERRSRPTLTQIFASDFVRATLDDGEGHRLAAFNCHAEPSKVATDADLSALLARWQASATTRSSEYVDCHCSVFTPAVFELLIREAIFLNLIPFEIVEIIESEVVEFYVHLRVTGYRANQSSSSEFNAVRNALLRRIQDESIETADRFRKLQKHVGACSPSNSETGLEEENSPKAMMSNALQEANDHLQGRNDALEEENASSRKTNDLLQGVNNLLRKENDSLQDASNLAEARATQLQRKIDTLLSSLSWRLTSPMRALSMALRRSVARRR
ncbi:MAG: hypothetical protein ACRYHA_13820 [Janthinobacterium lividum]